ncbi:MAG: two-component sensor histidine kinase [Nitrosopumilaceae archaeon]|nr:HAMP domain-containing histidine kinase [Nitrosopumilaceae archaeon]NIU01981.1 HAMP domain-containing histidine kinase [Nitrosopumilaceae archaeon]NIU87132.1 two-component sensor histidine kinase [Nitrosopumilaceae archaeon]NIV64622.1 two-component sensor histidine kinase [Nitrosopumilaceae archaeon]NIX62582.1 two-component sensor histidine kinase [Nitrosopumilaceae archaeon]
MLKIKQALFLMFGVTSFIIFYIGFLNFVTNEDRFLGTIMFVFSVIVSIGALIGTFYISKNITKPIESLVNKMNEFSTNNKIIKNHYDNHGIQELQHLHDNFEKMVAVIANTIEKEKRLNSELQKMDKRKVEFMSMISHELKTPIMPILGYIQLLKKQDMFGKLNAQQLDAINEIYLATVRLDKLIQDVLIAQKIDLEQLNVSKSRLKVEDIIETAYKLFLPLCEIKGVRIKKSISGNLYVNTDLDRVNQVFSNLISNSLGFMPESGGQIEIGATSHDNNVIFFVKDNGRGISRTEQKNIFKKFYQIDTSSRRRKEGSGLGLAICKGIVKKLGGEIWVESNMKNGTNFYFSLPKEKIKIKNY